MSTNWHWERDAEDIAWLHVHTPGHGPNVLSKDCLAELDAMLEELAKARPAAVIIMSDKENGFFAGANVEEFTLIKQQADAEQHIRWVHGILARLESLHCPTLALIHGFCLGAGLELALACR
jgi:3-hydroxyacyl-CoA dehydrogenase/enoyl-CoA hydratase/3-hydroxybutyryl-CoA epimerase